MIFESHSQEQTYDFAFNLAKNAKSGDIFLLNGDLGVGKTVFSKGFAKGLGVLETITSPTFTIMNIYESGRLNLYHFDVYRIINPDEAYDTGIFDYLSNDGVCLIEWAENIKEVLPKEALEIFISKNYELDENYRLIEVRGI